MLLVAPILLSLSIFGNEAFAYNSLFVQLIDDAINVLFPPVRISAHLCRIEEDDVIQLSRIMSKKGIAHEIHRDLEAFTERTYDTWEHQILHVLDLNCDYAVPLLRAANSTGMFRSPMKWLLLESWTNPGNFTSNKIEEMFKTLTAYPDSEVIVVRRLEDHGYSEITSVYRPSPFRDPIIEHRGTWTLNFGVRVTNFDAVPIRRRNLQQTPLISCLVMTDPDTINHLTDYENKHIDPVTKANYPWILHIVNRMNATVSFRTVNTWGYREANGSWNGMIGMLERREIDIGGTATFFISQRIGVVDYVQLYTRTSSSFVFRQPLLSTVSNIFTLPFQRSVWIAIAIFLLLVICLLYFSVKWEFRQGFSSSDEAEYWKQFNQAELTVSDNFMVVLGAVAQQGYSYEPYRVPPRIITLMLLIAALSLYAAYTANIVSLLQTTTDSIKTPTDLYYSPLKLAAQDVVYGRYYFKTFQDPIRRAIVDQKIEPKGKNSSWITIEEGVRRIRNELFAFHGERGTIFQLMQEQYQEDEKCGITEIDVLNVLYPLLVIQTRSPYLELIKSTALLLRETGLKFREEARLYTERPKCEGKTSFINIGLTESYFALVSMGYGTLLSLAVFIGEIIWHRKSRSFDFSLRLGSGIVSIDRKTSQTEAIVDEETELDEEKFPSDDPQ